MSCCIAAVATGGGVSAIGIVRMSGDGAISAADGLFTASGGVRLTDAEDRRLYYGELRDADGSLIDLCLCTVSRGPNSYTGEDTVEFHCHGSPVVLSEALAALRSRGARPAEAGEFTKRAFLNGRMDLTRAEAVIDLIEAETAWAAKNAAAQLKGSLGVKLDSVYDGLLDVMAHFHAAIDYPDEDVDDFSMAAHAQALHSAKIELERILATYERGKVMRDGVPTAIIGRPNTGKSSLLNALLGYDRAIVARTAGTTRDTIEEKAIIGGVLLRLTDTAGLRETEDEVERLGVERAVLALRGTGLAILVLDGSEELRDGDFEALRAIPDGVPKLAVVNKSDLTRAIGDDELDSLGIESCRVSALTGDGLDTLDGMIEKMFPEQGTAPGEALTNARHAGVISRALGCISRAIDAIGASVTPDAVLTEVEAALLAIGEATGRTMREDVTDRIFERFCVGK